MSFYIHGVVVCCDELHQTWWLNSVEVTMMYGKCCGERAG